MFDRLGSLVLKLRFVFLAAWGALRPEGQGAPPASAPPAYAQSFRLLPFLRLLAAFLLMLLPASAERLYKGLTMGITVLVAFISLYMGHHFKAVAEEAGLPVVVYTIPGRSVVNITPDTIHKLSQVQGIAAVILNQCTKEGATIPWPIDLWWPESAWNT